MRLLTFTLILTIAVAGCQQPGPKSSNLTTNGTDETVATDVNYFTKLRFDTANAPGFNPFWKTEPDREKVVAAYRAGQIDKFFPLADAWLKRMPIDADVHLMEAMCYKEEGRLANMCQQLNVFYGLLGSITAGGDGLSKPTAFKVVSTEEEYSLVQEIGGQVTKQSLDGGFDRLEVERRGGITLVLYFDLSFEMKAEAKALGQK